MDHDGLHPDSPLMTMSNSFLGDGMLSLSIPGPSRDAVYYIPDGNSVLLVENTLFKVRPTLSSNSGPEFGEKVVLSVSLAPTLPRTRFQGPSL